MAYDAARGVTVLFGGERNGQLLADTWEWDGAAWSFHGNAWALFGLTAREGHAMAYDPVRHRTVLFGGEGYAWPGGSGETWEWDGAIWSLRSSSGPSPRGFSGMVYDAQRGAGVLFGGRDISAYLDDTWLWDGTNWTQRSVSGPAARASHGMAFDSHRNVVVLHGGFRYQQQQGTVFNDTWEWDGDAWTMVSDSGPTVGPGPNLYYDSVRQVIALYSNDVPAEFWEWDGATWTLHTSPEPGVRFGSAIAYDEARDAAVLMGGYYDLTDTWERVGTQWSRRSAETMGSATPAASAYDAVRGVTVVIAYDNIWSGTGWTPVDETWEWDGNSWTRRAVDSGLPLFNDELGAVSGGLVFDRRRGVSVFVSASPSEIQTWEWDGKIWAFRTASGPPPRSSPSVTYDSWRDVTLLFGGVSECHELPPPAYWECDMAEDLWAWDGTAWQLVSTDGPDRAEASMIFDRMRGVAVVFGGSGEEFWGFCQQPLADTWEWDGTSWALRASTGPSFRSQAGIVYDTARGAAVLIGGLECDACCNSDAWEWDGVSWRQLPEAGIGGVGPLCAYDQERRTVVQSVSETWELVNECSCATTPVLRPYAERHTNCSGACYAPKSRYLSFVPPAVPGCGATGVALRVTLTDLPGASDCFGVPDASGVEGTQMWVGPEVLSMGGTPTGVYGLQPTPLFRDWTSVRGGVIHLSDCNVIPCAAYTIEAVADIHYPAGPYSEPLVLETAQVWGDVKDTLDGELNVLDVSAIVDCVRFAPPWPIPTWCDVHGRSSVGGADGVVNVLDVSTGVEALKGLPYLFSLPSAPNSCPP